MNAGQKYVQLSSISYFRLFLTFCTMGICQITLEKLSFLNANSNLSTYLILPGYLKIIIWKYDIAGPTLKNIGVHFISKLTLGIM